ncbi:MAG: hypothetical protein KAR22_20470 [Gammaproteobacteria bacterium]|nr:hypothetical protein [Gammaproteobacteria bacterium]
MTERGYRVAHLSDAGVAPAQRAKRLDESAADRGCVIPKRFFSQDVQTSGSTAYWTLVFPILANQFECSRTFAQ